jgi:hypothetical protein
MRWLPSASSRSAGRGWRCAVRSWQGRGYIVCYYCWH